jgi:hypothetical protein
LQDLDGSRHALAGLATPRARLEHTQHRFHLATDPRGDRGRFKTGPLRAALLQGVFFDGSVRMPEISRIAGRASEAASIRRMRPVAL